MALAEHITEHRKPVSPAEAFQMEYVKPLCGRSVRDTINMNVPYGWVVDQITDREILRVIQPEVIAMRPGGGWFGADAEARSHAQEWESRTGTKVLFLLVRDGRGWVSGPVLRRELVHEQVEILQDRYESAKPGEEKNGLRAAIIARTGKEPAGRPQPQVLKLDFDA